MFCSIKKSKDKIGLVYKFYISDRYRDKKTKKVKSSDKYVMSLQANEIINTSIENLKEVIEISCINKGINLENANLIIDKIKKLKDVVIINNDTTKNDIKDVVTQEYNTTNKNHEIEIVEAEIVEECIPDYKTTISFDTQQEFSKNIKESLNLNSMITVFGGRSKNEFEIEEEELNKIHDKADMIKDKIDKILIDSKEIEIINNRLKDLSSDIRIVQDIYISCYDKVPSSEMWVVGNGYIERIYYTKDFILPHEGYDLYEYWEEIKEEYKLDDSKIYINCDGEFKEIDLYGECTIELNKDDITGTLIKIIFSGNCEVDYTMSDFIDIKFNGNNTELSIEHLIDWINNKAIRDYKVDIENLLQYREQLYKYKKVEI